MFSHLIYCKYNSPLKTLIYLSYLQNLPINTHFVKKTFKTILSLYLVK
nr:MAG TPA: hypothetical protein [Caudoviricetes sp.]